MGAIEKTIQALADQVGSACQVVAICGRNKGLIKRLEAKQYPAGMQVQHASIPACSPGGGGGAHAALKLLSALGRLYLQAVSHPCRAHRILSHLRCMSCNVLGLPRLDKSTLQGVLQMCQDPMPSGTLQEVFHLAIVVLLHRLCRRTSDVELRNSTSLIPMLLFEAACCSPAPDSVSAVVGHNQRLCGQHA